jgi:integrase
MSKHTLNKLSAIGLGKLGDGWHADGGNLYLFVRGNSRTWVFRYTAPDGKRRNMGLGSIDDVPLVRARAMARDLRSQVKDPLAPVDPIETARADKIKRRTEKAKQATFKDCAEAFIEAKRAGWSNVKHAAQWSSTLETYAYPTIGSLPVADVDTALVVKILQPIWATKTETATRLRGRIESILDWAKTSGFRTGDNPAAWRGHLENLLAKPNDVATIVHFAALPFVELSAFMEKLRGVQGLGARALELAIFTAARSGEIRGATWEEIDLVNKVWVIPANRMKARKEHRVPLSPQAVKLLKGLPSHNNGGLLFPSSKPSLPLSNMTLAAVLKRMERSDLTAHGFRSTFRDWAAEVTHYPSEMAEMALAHTVSDKVEAAYRRGDMFDKRRHMMNEWATYCEKGAPNKLLKLA